MKTLTIVRHGTYKLSNPAIANVARPLTSKGRHETARAASRFAHLGLSPDLIVSSSAIRALQTGEIFGQKGGLSAEKMLEEPEIFAAERADLLRVINRLDDSSNNVVFVGHNPGITSIFHHLVDSDVYEMRPSAFAVIQFDVDRWHDVSFKKGKLLHYITPEVKEKKHGWRWRFFHWRKQRENKVEIFMIFLISLLLILASLGIIITLISSSLSKATPENLSLILW